MFKKINCSTLFKPSMPDKTSQKNFSTGLPSSSAGNKWHNHFFDKGEKVMGYTKHDLASDRKITVFSPNVLYSDFMSTIEKEMSLRNCGFALFKLNKVAMSQSQNISLTNDAPEATQLRQYQVSYEDLEPVKYLQDGFVAEPVAKKFN